MKPTVRNVRSPILSLALSVGVLAAAPAWATSPPLNDSMSQESSEAALRSPAPREQEPETKEETRSTASYGLGDTWREGRMLRTND